VTGAICRPGRSLGDVAVRPAAGGLGPLAAAGVDLDAIAANVRVVAEAARGAALPDALPGDVAVPAGRRATSASRASNEEPTAQPRSPVSFGDARL
jgi:hypothetical protein